MVNRDNYQLVKEFVAYLRDITQIEAASLDRYWSYLKHLLMWADEVPLSQVVDKRPTFAAYLTTARGDAANIAFAPLTVKKIFQMAKRFLQWAKSSYPREFKAVGVGWIESLRLPRRAESPKEHQFVRLDEVLLLTNVPVDESDLALSRDKAAAALLFLSGIRAGALGSLTLECVDLPSRTVKQWPALGVKTKNRKSATTNLLNIPDLLGIAAKWDSFVRARLPLTAPWYSPIVSHWGEQTLTPDSPGENRNIALAKRLRKLFTLAHLPYRSPHKFRHGHAVYALQHANTMADYKAVSMNLMHSDIRVTDSIYAPLARDEVKQRIEALTGPPSHTSENSSLSSLPDISDDELLDVLAQRLKAKGDS